jgi:hypothetical protein
MRLKTLCLAAVLVCSQVAQAEAQQLNGRRGFDRLTKLVGSWSMGGRAAGRGVTTYRLGDDGRTLIQDEAGQLTVFKLDGDSLTLIHYCARGNQPRMRLQTLDDGRMTFSMYDITNLKHPRAYHTTGLQLVFVSDDRIDLIYRATSDGRESTDVIPLTRKRSGE